MSRRPKRKEMKQWRPMNETFSAASKGIGRSEMKGSMLHVRCCKGDRLPGWSDRGTKVHWIEWRRRGRCTRMKLRSEKRNDCGYGGFQTDWENSPTETPKKPKSSFEVSPPITQLMCLSELAMHVTSRWVNEMSRLRGKLVLEKQSGRPSLQTISFLIKVGSLEGENK